MKTKNQPVKVHSTISTAENKNDNMENTSTEKQSPKTPSNLVVLTGHLGKDPVVNEFDGGRKKAFFTMATNGLHYNKEGAQIEETAWHSLVAWGKLADTVQTFLRKGDKVSVTGRLNYHNYTDKSGVKKIFTEIIMNSLVVIPTKQAV
jgi:single-strand DNA-binding protein